MSGSTFGKNFTMTTWGESHGKALGVVIDGCPAGITLTEDMIQEYMNRRKPGQSKLTTPRNEADAIEILSGVFEDKTTGCPISLMVRNADQHSKDYSNIATTYRPGHADFCFDAKYGTRDYRGGGRSSGRETLGRVAAGAVAASVLKELGIEVMAYTKAIGPVEIESFDKDEINNNIAYMPDKNAAEKAVAYLEECRSNQDSAGGVIECVVKGMPAGVGDPVFDKLDANLAKALMSIGAVKAVEIGDGIEAAKSNGSINNDSFKMDGEKVSKATNHAGGILGGISDGSEIILRAHIKPTPSISQEQKTVNKEGEDVNLSIHGRHDPVIVPRAVVVVETMVAATILDSLLSGMGAKIENLKKVYN